jgi:hypothetical protein
MAMHRVDTWLWLATTVTLSAVVMLIPRLYPRRKATIPELIAMCQKYGEDPDVERELGKIGAPARDEVIRRLLAVPAGELDSSKVAAMIRVLVYQFPGEEACQTLTALRSRTAIPWLEKEWMLRSTILRAQLNGQPSEEWRRRSRTPAEERLEYDEMLLANAAPADKRRFLPDVARAALGAGDLARAEAYAREILAAPEGSTIDGDGIYWANDVLGACALRRGDVAAAGGYLIASGRTPGSWDLSGNGPDFSLAKHLLEAGQQDDVLQYLNLCKLFWQAGVESIERWEERIAEGRQPDFQKPTLA